MNLIEKLQKMNLKDLKLFPHQIIGIRKTVSALRHHSKFFIIADEQGLGKTIEAICSCKVMGFKKILVVCPLFVREEWSRMLGDYTNESFMLLNNKESFLGRARFEIVNYDRIRKFSKEFANRKYDCIVCDEFHNIKNRNAKRTQAVFNIDTPYKLFLSGTPILNRTEELWTALNYGDSKEWPNYWEFVDRYSKRKQIPIRMFRYGKWIEIFITKYIGGKNLGELRKKLSKVMIRRRKVDVINLPPKIYQTFLVNLTGKQRKIYDRLLKDLLIKIGKKSITVRGALSKFTRLRQVCCGLETISDEDSSSAKIDLLVQFCEDNLYGEHKVFVVSPFVSTAREAFKRLKKYGAVYVDGSTDSHAAHVNKSRFNKHPKCRAYVGTIGRNKEGIDLTGGDYVIFLGKSFVEKINQQVEDRVHRIGQKGSVNIINILCKDTIEQKIEEMLFEKAKLSGELIDGVDLSSPIITSLDDIRKILK